MNDVHKLLYLNTISWAVSFSPWGENERDIACLLNFNVLSQNGVRRAVETHEVHESGKSLGSVVGMATGGGLDDRGVGVRVQLGSRLFI
jgi:hypothetical protein